MYIQEYANQSPGLSNQIHFFKKPKLFVSGWVFPLLQMLDLILLNGRGVNLKVWIWKGNPSWPEHLNFDHFRPGLRGVMRNLHSAQQCMKEANENYPHLYHSCSIANHTVMVSDKKKIEVPLFTGMALTLILLFSKCTHIFTDSFECQNLMWHFCIVYACLESCSRDCSVSLFFGWNRTKDCQQLIRCARHTDKRELNWNYILKIPKSRLKSN